MEISNTDDDMNISYEKMLAVTHSDASKDAHDGNSFTPTLLWRTFYRGEQADAVEFLEQLLQIARSPNLYTYFHWRNP